uniref:Uncharacterized protein n=1 Tax=Sphaerodactylus townsendi TaxID=933632 RepID=A0ACB8E539_9SAUR
MSVSPVELLRPDRAEINGSQTPPDKCFCLQPWTGERKSSCCFTLIKRGQIAAEKGATADAAGLRRPREQGKDMSKHRLVFSSGPRAGPFPSATGSGEEGVACVYHVCIWESILPWPVLVHRCNVGGRSEWPWLAVAAKRRGGKLDPKVHQGAKKGLMKQKAAAGAMGLEP